MPRFIVKNTTIKHGAKGATTAAIYVPGDRINLTCEEARKLGGNVELDGEQVETDADKKGDATGIHVVKGPVSSKLNPKEPLAATKGPVKEKPDVPAPKGPVAPTELNATKAPKAAKEGKK